MLHYFDTKESSHLYKMNYPRANTILLDVSIVSKTGDEFVQFPNEDEIYEMITKKDDEASCQNAVVEEYEERQNFKCQEAW